MMTVPYPLGYPIVNPGMNYWSYDLFTYPINHSVDLPLTFYLEFATTLEPNGTGFCARTSSNVGALFIKLFRLKMPYSYWVIILTELLYAFYTKKRARQTDPYPAQGTADTLLNYYPDTDLNPDSNPNSGAKSETFPRGLDIYLAASSVFEQNTPRGTAWFYYFLKNFKCVPVWFVPAAILIVWAVNRMFCHPAQGYP